MKLHSDAVNRLLFALTLVVLVATVVILLLVARQYRDEMDRTINDTVTSFRRAAVFRDPGDTRPNFSAFEAQVRSAESSRFIQEVFAVRQIAPKGSGSPGSRAVLVHPWWYSAAHPGWQAELAGLERRPIRDGEGVDLLGALYFDLDTRALWYARAGIVAALVLIVAMLTVLLVRILTQERVLVATTQILEENQRELIRLERLSLAGLLTANIFHDIRKPMTNVKHELAELAEALGSFAGASRALKNMRGQVNLFFDILHDLNIERFVRSDQADEEYVDLNRVMEQSIQLVQYERRGAQLSVTLAQGLPLVLAHPYRLVQVFSNIILNAYQAMEGRGELRIATSVTQGEAGGWVVAEISDTGPGIAPDRMDQVFSPFYTTKASGSGSGLGLYISRTIVEQAGGRLRASSAPGEGTTFIIELPASD